MIMHEITSKSGRRILYMGRSELEALPGYKGTHSGTKARACCPVHEGDNPTTLDIDYGRGWAGCYACGDAFSIRIEDHPDTYRSGSGTLAANGWPVSRPQSTPVALNGLRASKTGNDTGPDPDAVQRLSERLRGWQDAYAGSPVAAYVRTRGIPDDIATRLGWGYVSDSAYLARHRLFIPFTDLETGMITGGVGRAADNTTKPKTLNLRNKDGYRTSPVNGLAIAEARAARAPLVVTEGAFDTAACLAGGMRYAIALNGVSIRPEMFAGIPRVFMATDHDTAGREAVDRFRRSVPVQVDTWEDDDLKEFETLAAKDVAAYWQKLGALPYGLHVVAADQIYPRLSPDLRTEARELSLELWRDPALLAETRAAAADDARPADDLAAFRYALTLHDT